MLVFLHDRLRTLGKLLAQSNDVLAKYNRADLDLATSLTGFLDDAIAAYGKLSQPTVENRMLALKADMVSAAHGTNPMTLERVATNRRAMQRAVALRVLQASGEQLRADVDADTKQLADAGAQLRPIVLAAMQRGIVRPEHCGRGRDHDVERIWRELLADEDIQLAARQLAMQVSVYDIQLLLDALLDAAGA